MLYAPVSFSTPHPTACHVVLRALPAETGVDASHAGLQRGMSHSRACLGLRQHKSAHSLLPCSQKAALSAFWSPPLWSGLSAGAKLPEETEEPRISDSTEAADTPTKRPAKARRKSASQRTPARSSPATASASSPSPAKRRKPTPAQQRLLDAAAAAQEPSAPPASNSPRPTLVVRCLHPLATPAHPLSRTTATAERCTSSVPNPPHAWPSAVPAEPVKLSPSLPECMRHHEPCLSLTPCVCACWQLQASPTVPPLQVCPVSVLSNWEVQIAEHCVGLSSCVLHGPARSAVSAAALAKHDIVITTYGVVVSDARKLKRVRRLLLPPRSRCRCFAAPDHTPPQPPL